MGLNKPVDFTTAKLLKEKGFDENCRFGYNGSFEPHHIGLIEFGYLQRNSELLKLTYSAPTIAEVVMWLYEKHGIWISVYSGKALNWESLFSVRIDWIYPTDSPDAEDIEPQYFKYKSQNEFNSPTEAYESAIEYTLNNLI